MIILEKVDNGMGNNSNCLPRNELYFSHFELFPWAELFHSYS